MRRRHFVMAGIAACAAGPARAATNPVVLELFTSQGCSSCPPADALLGRLARRSGVIALAWHVDYWDHLGWRDRFASRAATERQRAYAGRLGGGVFTPALVVNGAAVVIGSQGNAVEAAIGAASALPVAVALRRSEDAVTVEVGASPGPVRVLRVVYDPETATDVGGGENDGDRLREYRIVREADTLGESAGGALRFTARPAGTWQGLTILVQSADLRILGAADLPVG